MDTGNSLLAGKRLWRGFDYSLPFSAEAENERVKVKVKLSLYSPAQTLRVPGLGGPQDF